MYPNPPAYIRPNADHINHFNQRFLTPFWSRCIFSEFSIPATSSDLEVGESAGDVGLYAGDVGE